MLVALICNCHSAPSLVRQFLFSQRHPNPSSVHFYRGEEAMSFAKRHSLKDVVEHLHNRSSYAVLVGWDELGNLDWADINLSTAEQILKAEVIVKRFT